MIVSTLDGSATHPKTQGAITRIVHPILIVAQISLHTLDLFSCLVVAAFEEFQALNHVCGLTLFNALSLLCGPGFGRGGAFTVKHGGQLPQLVLDVIEVE